METENWWRYQDRAFRLGLIPFELMDAGSGADVALHLSNCFDGVRHKGRKFVISVRLRDELIRLAVRAEVAAHATFPKFYERDIHCGMQALAATFSIWAMALEDRDSFEVDHFTDIDDRRRILQNIVHNEALKEQLEDRAYARRADEIEGLIAPTRHKQGRAS